MQVETWTITGSGFHFGRHGLGQEESGEHLTSDSLFAALTARQSALGGAPAVESWMQYFIKAPPAFIFSSAFPQAGEVRFFPRPMRSFLKEETRQEQDPKNLKRVKYVSEEIFLKILNGSSLEMLYSKENTLQGGVILVDVAERSKLPRPLRSKEGKVWITEQRPRVVLGRTQVNSTLYFTGRTAFSPDCGLWFGVRWIDRDQNLVSRLTDTLMDLGDAGIGGERANGFGRAEIKPDKPIELPDPTGLPWVTLSRYLPTGQDQPALLYSQAAYHIETVGGWVESPGNPAERRRSVRMLVEGSVFGPLEGSVPGRIVDVQPTYGGNQPLGHPVWRNGLALAVGYPGAARK